VGQHAYERYGLTGLPAVLSRIWLAWSHAERGEFAEAMVPAEEALAIAESARQPYSVAAAYLAVGQVRLVQGALAQAIPVLEHAAGLCKAWSLGGMFPTTAAALGLAHALCGGVGGGARAGARLRVSRARGENLAAPGRDQRSPRAPRRGLGRRSLSPVSR